MKFINFYFLRKKLIITKLLCPQKNNFVTGSAKQRGAQIYNRPLKVGNIICKIEK
jgi:hypothetical protein